MEPDNDSKENKTSDNESEFPGYPAYPESEDTLSVGHKKEVIPLDGDLNDSGPTAQSFKPAEPKQGLESDLDVPGAELDDVEELLGEEDEENNYYSLGGDRHEDLEEDSPSN